MKWRKLEIWLPIFLVVGALCGGYSYEYDKKEDMSPAPVTKGLDNRVLLAEKPNWTPEQKQKWVAKHKAFKDIPRSDYADAGLKIGSGFGGIMSIIGFFEKILGWFRKKKCFTSL